MMWIWLKFSCILDSCCSWSYWKTGLYEFHPFRTFSLFIFSEWRYGVLDRGTCAPADSLQLQPYDRDATGESEYWEMITWNLYSLTSWIHVKSHGLIACDNWSSWKLHLYVVIAILRSSLSGYLHVYRTSLPVRPYVYVVVSTIWYQRLFGLELRSTWHFDAPGPGRPLSPMRGLTIC